MSDVRVEQVGPHWLYLGDCLELMPRIGMVDHIVTDPPYEAVMHQAKSEVGRRMRRDGHAELAAVDFSDVEDLRAAVVVQAGMLCFGWVILFCTPEGVARWADEINGSDIRYKRACVWVKPDAAPQFNGQGPAMGAEMFVCAWAGSGHSRWNAGGKRGVYTHLTNPSDRDGRHPTEKPWRLMAEILNDFTGGGHIVLDPFMGTGATGIAAIRTGRRFIGIE